MADVGDVPFSSRYDIAASHREIEAWVAAIVAQGALPLSVGGDHSITYPILRAVGRQRPVGLVHIDAHSDTGGPFDGLRENHGAPFRNAVLAGVLDPTRTVQIGLRGASEYLYEFATDSGMTCIHAEEIDTLGIAAIIERARAVVGEGPVYVSFDIDSLDPAFAPGTGTPEIGGLTTREVAGDPARAEGDRGGRRRRRRGGAAIRRDDQHRPCRGADAVRDPQPDGVQSVAVGGVGLTAGSASGSSAAGAGTGRLFQRSGRRVGFWARKSLRSNGFFGVEYPMSRASRCRSGRHPRGLSQARVRDGCCLAPAE